MALGERLPEAVLQDWSGGSFNPGSTTALLKDLGFRVVGVVEPFCLAVLQSPGSRGVVELQL